MLDLKNLLIKHFLGISVLVGLCVIIVDQVLKYKIRHNGGFYLCNEGISFSIQLPNLILWLILSFFFLLLLFYYIVLNKKSLFFIEAYSLALFLGGVFSNILDRFLFGCVIDYISLTKSFPVFNIADIGIFLGSCFIILFIFKKSG